MPDNLFDDPRLDILWANLMKEVEDLDLPEHELVAFMQTKLSGLEGGMSQGARAGRSGGFLEKNMRGGFEQFGVRIVKDNPEYHHDEILWRRKEKFLIEQPTMRGIKPDFLYIDFWKGIKVAIECKQQTASGSTDRKLSYVIDDLMKLPITGFWIAISGAGWSKKVLHIVQNKIVEANRGTGIRGRLVHDTILYRCIEQLVERGSVI